VAQRVDQSRGQLTGVVDLIGIDLPVDELLSPDHPFVAFRQIRGVVLREGPEQLHIQPPGGQAREQGR
jgi:hypothetical protein